MHRSGWGKRKLGAGMATNRASYWATQAREMERQQMDALAELDVQKEPQDTKPPRNTLTLEDLTILDPFSDPAEIRAAVQACKEESKESKAEREALALINVISTEINVAAGALPEHTLRLDEVRTLSSAFPPNKSRFMPSEFQRRVLEHISSVRQVVHHKRGLLVMATALGKTVVVALDIERELLALSTSYFGHPSVAPFEGHDIERIMEDNVRGVTKRPTDPPGIFIMGFDGLDVIEMPSQRVAPTYDSDDSEPATPRRVEPISNIAAAMKKSDFAFTMLFLVHTTSIRDAAYEKIKFHMKGLGVKDDAYYLNLAGATSSAHLKACYQVTSGHRKTSHFSAMRPRFVFSTFQQFNASFIKGESSVGKSFIDSVTHVIFDEVHHLLANTYNQVYRALKAAPNLKSMVGITATLRHQTDPTGANLRDLFDGVLYIEFPWTSAKKLGHFPDVSYYEVMTMIGARLPTRMYSDVLTDCSTTVDGDLRLQVTDFMRAMNVKNDSPGPEQIANTYVDFNDLQDREGQPIKKRTMIFVANIDLADRTALALKGKGVSAYAAHSKTIDAHDVFARFQAGKIPVIITVMMATEGYDVPGVDCVILARPTKSEIVFVQQMGRGLRRDASAPDKKVAILDMTYNLRHRWRRLSSELATKDLVEQIGEFWTVNAFIMPEG